MCFSLCWAEPEEPDHDDEPVGGAVLVRPQAGLDPRGTVQTYSLAAQNRARILKLLWNPRIDSKEPIPPAV
jgi:hypothetical protein